MTPEDTNEQFADQQPRCEIGKTSTANGECQRLGEVQLDGSWVCVTHTELLRLGRRSEALLFEVFKMDEWLESVDGQADELHVLRAEHHRNELVEQLRFNRARIGLTHDELLKNHDGTTEGMPLRTSVPPSTGEGLEAALIGKCHPRTSTSLGDPTGEIDRR